MFKIVKNLKINCETFTEPCLFTAVKLNFKLVKMENHVVVRGSTSIETT